MNFLPSKTWNGGGVPPRGVQASHQKAVVENKECSIVDCILFSCLPLCCMYALRQQIKTKYGIGEGLLFTVLAVWCCAICGIVQQQRHLIAKGDRPAGCFMD